ncbi:hypothetical protein AMS68_004343 [Peltaster fructicola]|uniref:Secreted protein n=1 Tax=Peltaster fructicola TaxID=286661 RepID=A0A6H0XVW2_9PEZI|nr:hypothetical protein AMS68_004343 [Peltaster fructicola]
MMSFKVFLVVAFSCTSYTHAATTPCLGPPDRLPAWACILCGPNTDQCLPYNATFDDIQAGKPVGNYNDVTWTNFIVENARASSNKDHLVPYSAPNLARLPAGQEGTMITKGGELIYDFHYGCTTPAATVLALKKPVAPTSCIVSLSGLCSYDRAHATPQRWSFNFNTTCRPQTQLNGYDKSHGYVGPGYGACANFTWSATAPNGGPVDLYLDEVIYKRVPYW